MWKEAISFVMSVYPSVRTEQLASHWTDFHEIWYLSNFFRKSVEQIQVSLKSNNNNGLYMKINVKLWSYLAEFFSDWKMFQTTVVEKIKTCILCSIAFFENRVVYEIMWENTVEPDRPQMITEHGACVLRAGYRRLQAHTQSLIRIAFRLVARMRLTVTLYVKRLSCCYHQKLYQHFAERLVFMKTLLGLHHNEHE